MILHNKIKCKKCGDVIESVHRHDFKYCECGSVAVDGGKDYLRRIGDYIELSEEQEDKRGTWS
jgi:Zn finger protein HypA/HybF involved in hydrogenase expression